MKSFLPLVINLAKNSLAITISDLKDIVVLCSFKIKIDIQNLEHGCITDQQPGFEKHGYCLPLQILSDLI